MGNIWGKIFSRKEARILMMGLDAAGKTTMLYRLKLGEVVTTIPTIGFNVETIEHKKVKITAWDVGGRHKMRPLFRHYYPNTDAVIFVVDSNDRDRMEYVRDEIHRTLSEDELKNTPLLVVANKQDIPGAMKVDELVNDLDLNKIKEHNWYIQQAVAMTGEGLYEGLDWLVEQIARGYVQQSVEQLTSNTKSDSQKSSAVVKEQSGFGYISDVLKSTFKWITASK